MCFPTNEDPWHDNSGGGGASDLILGKSYGEKSTDW